jgi:hypothetical protein
MFSLPVKLKDSAAKSKEDLLVGNTDTGGQNLPVQVDPPRKPDVRQEPPVPVEPQAVPSIEVAEKKEEKQEKLVIPPVLQHGEQQVRMNQLHCHCISVSAIPSLQLSTQNLF